MVKTSNRGRNPLVWPAPNSFPASVYEGNSTEVHKLLLSGSEDLLNGVCSAMCAKNNNPGGDGKQSCIGFSTNVTDDYTCKLYSDVAFAKSANRIASKEKLYQK